MIDKISTALLERRARTGDPHALGSLAIYYFNCTRHTQGLSPLAVALFERAAVAGDNRCSRMLALFLMLGWRGMPADPERAKLMWRLHARNERRFKARIERARIAKAAISPSKNR